MAIINSKMKSAIGTYFSLYAFPLNGSAAKTAAKRKLKMGNETKFKNRYVRIVSLMGSVTKPNYAEIDF